MSTGHEPYPEDRDALRQRLEDAAKKMEMYGSRGHVSDLAIAKLLRDASSALASSPAVSLDRFRLMVHQIAESEWGNIACVPEHVREALRGRCAWPFSEAWPSLTWKQFDEGLSALASPPEHDERTHVIRDGTALPASTVPATASANEPVTGKPGVYVSTRQTSVFTTKQPVRVFDAIWNDLVVCSQCHDEMERTTFGLDDGKSHVSYFCKACDRGFRIERIAPCDGEPWPIGGGVDGFVQPGDIAHCEACLEAAASDTARLGEAPSDEA